VQLPVGGSPVAIAHPIAGGYRRGRYVDYCYCYYRICRLMVHQRRYVDYSYFYYRIL
jgi:hypothetical protein